MSMIVNLTSKGRIQIVAMSAAEKFEWDREQTAIRKVAAGKATNKAWFKAAQALVGDVFRYGKNMEWRGRVQNDPNPVDVMSVKIARYGNSFEGKFKANFPVLLDNIGKFCNNEMGASLERVEPEERLDWVHRNLSEIVWFGLNPAEGIAAYQSGNSFIDDIRPFMYYAQDIANAMHTGNSSKMIWYDATSSGSQILAILARDSEIMRHVNICSPEHGRGDLYIHVADTVIEQFSTLAGFHVLTLGDWGKKTQNKKYSVKDKNHYMSQVVWSDSYTGIEVIDYIMAHPELFNRAVGKLSSMNFSYGQSNQSVREVIRKYFLDTNAIKVDNHYLALAIMKTIADMMIWGREQVLGGLYEVMEFFKLMQSKARYDNLEFPMDDGYTYQNEYKEMDGNGYIAAKTKKAAAAKAWNSKMSGISPQIVHGLDSLILRTWLGEMRLRQIPMQSVHDAFAVPSCYAEESRQILMETIIKMFKGRNRLAEMVKHNYNIGAIFNDDDYQELMKVANDIYDKGNDDDLIASIDNKHAMS